ncbi:TPA: hypothetical protein LWI60_002186 [Listeria innocua]|uniref:DUF7352 domain-containing protein n=1 Tax=Listeria monocytogenes serotype 1/2b TaxID=2291966 RepID=A0A823FKY8_LISMN|nr:MULTISPECIES: hypothetical protein [Listeria]EAE3707005.1 hypothetical protein [Listeria monocytogenes serotype 1/2b]QPQ95153.1 hypothetical protein I6H04_08645 [Listeria welshimeri]EAC6189523.1 hypothetical protein [Listeria monocytogenes]EAC6601586.1 hypothetical protein [Listeria monocytogenes]EAD2972694.1 hypothetical protein [Listeria monocytogenes]
MNLKIYKYPLAIKDSQVITLPAESTVLSIKNQHEVPVLYAAVNTACEIEGYVNIECRGTGQMLNGKEVTEITETLLFQNGNLVLHFFAQKFPQVVRPQIKNFEEENE